LPDQSKQWRDLDCTPQKKNAGMLNRHRGRSTIKHIKPREQHTTNSIARERR
jgi:hypothetical protein